MGIYSCGPRCLVGLTSRLMIMLVNTQMLGFCDHDHGKTIWFMIMLKLANSWDFPYSCKHNCEFSSKIMIMIVKPNPAFQLQLCEVINPFFKPIFNKSYIVEKVFESILNVISLKAKGSLDFKLWIRKPNISQENRTMKIYFSCITWKGHNF